MAGRDVALRDIIDYQLIAWDSCLYNAALHREELLRNFYRVGQRQMARTEPVGHSSSQPISAIPARRAS